MTTKDVRRYLQNVTEARTNDERELWLLLGIFRVLQEMAVEMGAIDDGEE